MSFNFAISYLYVSVLPQILPFSFGDEQINLDEAVVATCIMTKGDLPIDIWWTLSNEFQSEEKNLTTNDGVVITKTGNKLSVLNIEAVKGRHRGKYTCYAKNKAGISVYSASLAINGESLAIIQSF